MQFLIQLWRRVCKTWNNCIQDCNKNMAVFHSHTRGCLGLKNLGFKIKQIIACLLISTHLRWFRFLIPQAYVKQKLLFYLHLDQSQALWPDLAICHHFGNFWMLLVTIFLPKITKSPIYKSFDVYILGFEKFVVQTISFGLRPNH